MAKLASGTRVYGTATVDTFLSVNSTLTSTSTFGISAINTPGGMSTRDMVVRGSVYAADSNVPATLNTTTTNAFTFKDLTESLDTTTGALVVGGGVGIASNLHVNGTFVYKQSQENFLTLSGSTGVVVHDYSLSGVFYHTSPAGNFTANITNLNTASNLSSVLDLTIVQGASPVMCTGIQIDGVAQTIRWSNGIQPGGTANKKDNVVFNIFKVGGTYYVLGAAAYYAVSSPPVGQQAYTTPGTYSWTAPTGVTSVSVVAIGGGGGGSQSSAGSAGGGHSYFINQTTVMGGGGAYAPFGNYTLRQYGGSYVGDGGGLGGLPDTTQDYSPGGGGAGGYTGDGGTGIRYTNSGATAGAGGGGGGGGIWLTHQSGGGGGGVGILGQGTSGAAGTSSASEGIAGSGGTSGQGGQATVGGTGGTYGGGGGGGANDGAWAGGGGGGLGWKNNITVIPGNTYTVVVGAGGGPSFGGGGAVRIIWPGTLRQFPSTRTANE